MAPETDPAPTDAPDGPDAAGAIVPPRNADGTPGRPAPDPHEEATVTDEAAEAIETETEAGDEISQP
ncbi:MAG: hypothetical protein WD178_09930 [Actinomycetota bacterium]